MKTQKSPIERTLYLSLCAVSVLTTLLSLTITFSYVFSRQNADTDKIISGTAAHIATMPNVVDMLQLGYPDNTVTLLLDSLCDAVPDINVAVVCDSQGMRFYHTDRQKTGESYLSEDQTRILSGAEPYITTGYGTFGSQRRAFHSVQDSDGEIIGFVMISVFSGNLASRTMSILAAHGVILVFMLIISLALSGGIMRFLRRSLLGLRPEELLGRYLRQDQVLGAVEEGLVASDAEGRVLFANSTACRLLGRDDELVGSAIAEIFPQTSAQRIRETSESVHHQTWLIGHSTVMANEIPIQFESQNENAGVLTVLFDKTELLHLADELFDAKSMLETLRSFNHEFSNKLHVILGYLETGQVQQAIRLILSNELVSSQHICQTADLIRAPELSALVLGKMLRAAEEGITLSLMPDSHCLPSELLLPVSECVSLIGNLLQNAIDELCLRTAEPRQINLGIYTREDCNIFICEDTGGGVNPDIVKTIYQQGISTKGKNRGIGLWLVNRIVSSYGGKIELDTEPEVGTVFTVTFAKQDS